MQYRIITINPLVLDLIKQKYGRVDITGIFGVQL